MKLDPYYIGTKGIKSIVKWFRKIISFDLSNVFDTGIDTLFTKTLSKEAMITPVRSQWLFGYAWLQKEDDNFGTLTIYFFDKKSSKTKEAVMIPNVPLYEFTRFKNAKSKGSFYLRWYAERYRGVVVNGGNELMNFSEIFGDLQDFIPPQYQVYWQSLLEFEATFSSSGIHKRIMKVSTIQKKQFNRYNLKKKSNTRKRYKTYATKKK